ncbi:MAG: glycosyltransferase [Thalassospira sp.]|uniref:glycosyltransferase n=1 Tax=Thalassospira sp. TaxID=1912094 RepID=UPI0032EB8FD5
MEEPIKVYVGADRSQELAVKVLEYSIKRHTKSPVEVISMVDLEIPEPNDLRQGQRTGFSFARWAIPELAGYKGRAIYLDADMQVFRDIADLWNVPFNGAKIAVLEPQRESANNVHYSKNESSVMVLDCEKCVWALEGLVERLDRDYTYDGLMRDLCFLDETEIARTIPADWNRLETFPASTGLLHFTLMPTQPWVSARNPLGHIWIDEVRRMVKEGVLTLDAVKKEIDLGYFRPSLMVEITEGPTRDGDDERICLLEEIDRTAGYVAHKTVEEFKLARIAAIRSYERRAALEKGPSAYVTLLAKDVLAMSRAFAGRVKRRFIG